MSPAARVLLAASVAAVLLGVASIVIGLLVPAHLAAERLVKVAEQTTAEEIVAKQAEAGAHGNDEATGASGGVRDARAADVRIDPDWLHRVATEAGIPERALTAYAEAAARLAREQPGCGLGWNTLAGIGLVESEHGTIGGAQIGLNGAATPPIIGIALDGRITDAIPDTDGGVLDGDPVWDRAVGPMQFIPSTWARWGSDGNGDGTVDPQHIDDATYSAARYLCAAGNLRDPARWISAVAAYNNTVDYNHRVAEAASFYAEISHTD